MNSILELLPKEQLFWGVVAVFLPTIVGFLLYLKAEKDKIVDFVVDEIDDVLADLNAAKIALVNCIDFAEDAIEGLIEGLGPDSPGGTKLTQEEKDEALEMASKALSQLKLSKEKIVESAKLFD